MKKRILSKQTQTNRLVNSIICALQLDYHETIIFSVLRAFVVYNSRSSTVLSFQPALWLSYLLQIRQCVRTISASSWGVIRASVERSCVAETDPASLRYSDTWMSCTSGEGVRATHFGHDIQNRHPFNIFTKLEWLT